MMMRYLLLGVCWSYVLCPVVIIGAVLSASRYSAFEQVFRCIGGEAPVTDDDVEFTQEWSARLLLKKTRREEGKEREREGEGKERE